MFTRVKHLFKPTEGYEKHSFKGGVKNNEGVDLAAIATAIPTSSTSSESFGNRNVGDGQLYESEDDAYIEADLQATIGRNMGATQRFKNGLYRTHDNSKLAALANSTNSRIQQIEERPAGNYYNMENVNYVLADPEDIWKDRQVQSIRQLVNRRDNDLDRIVDKNYNGPRKIAARKMYASRRGGAGSELPTTTPIEYQTEAPINSESVSYDKVYNEEFVRTINQQKRQSNRHQFGEQLANSKLNQRNHQIANFKQNYGDSM